LAKNQNHWDARRTAPRLPTVWNIHHKNVKIKTGSQRSISMSGIKGKPFGNQSDGPGNGSKFEASQIRTDTSRQKQMPLQSLVDHGFTNQIYSKLDLKANDDREKMQVTRWFTENVLQSMKRDQDNCIPLDKVKLQAKNL
jgi:hypothetical protein